LWIAGIAIISVLVLTRRKRGVHAVTISVINRAREARGMNQQPRTAIWLAGFLLVMFGSTLIMEQILAMILTRK